MAGGVAIFVKTPSLSPVKTRLASDVGQLRAEAFYLSSAEAVASVALDAQAQGGPAAYWAVAEATAIEGDAWADLPSFPQGRGTLGERMDHVYRLLRCKHHFALLIGADTPQLTASSLLRAAQWLASPEPRLVLGRAVDGGFWIFGGNTPLPGTAWRGPRYSSAHTADDVVAAMNPFGCWLNLESLTDVDYAQDLPRVQAELNALTQPTAAQQRLAQWLEDARMPARVRI
jgi:glycosyltransferase A (GT-A) superfamily protein (DUF2064 family)